MTDENGAARPMEVESDDGMVSIVSRASDYLHGAQTFVLAYSLENVAWNFPDTGLEFYWDVDGVDRAQPFGSVTARLHLAPELAASLSGRMACYQGYQVLLGKTTKAIPAEVLEQAVAQSIRIVEGPASWLGKGKLTAELVDPSRADGDGRMLLDGLFPQGVPGETYQFGTQDTRFSGVAQKILAAAEAELKNRGLRRFVPGATRAAPIIVGGVGMLAVAALGAGALVANVHPAVPLIVMAVAVVIFFAIVGLCVRKPLTAQGAETRDHLLGLEQFIAWAEADRIRMLQSPQGAERVAVDVDDPRQKLQLYEKLLPYAVVFGQEKQWSKELAVLYTAVGATGPYWYHGTGAFDASSFASGIGTLSSAAMSSSSTSGGSGGGGGAGGGGGGGGGGGV